MSIRSGVVRDVLEPCAGRLASTVLKGLRDSNVPWLPGHSHGRISFFLGRNDVDPVQTTPLVKDHQESRP